MQNRTIRQGRFYLLQLLLAWALVAAFLMAPQARGEKGKPFEVSEEKIRQTVVRFLKKSHPWRDGDVRIRDVRVPGSIVLPSRSYELSIRISPNTRYLGHTPLQLVFDLGRAGKKRIWASAYVEVMRPVVIARYPMERNQMISARDVCLEKRDMARVPLGAVTDLNWVVGRRLKRAVRMGTILKKAMVDMPPLVKRGDVVNLVIETGRLKITALGRAEQRGGKGDTVRVVNLDSKRRIYGKVVDSRTIQVRY